MNCLVEVQGEESTLEHLLTGIQQRVASRSYLVELDRKDFLVARVISWRDDTVAEVKAEVNR